MKFLVIQQKMIGDVLTSSILCDNLKKEFPEATVHYMVHKHTTAVIEHHPSIDHIIRFDPVLRRNKLHLYRYIKQLNKEGYDVIIDAYTKLESSLITLISKPEKSIGYYKWYSSFAYSHPVKRWSKSKYGLGLAIENRLQLLFPVIGARPMDTLVTRPRIYLTDSEKKEAASLLKAHGIEPDTQPLMISILGSDPTKSYPARFMASFLDDLVAGSDNILLFNYIPKQIEAVKEIYNHCKPETRERIKLDLFANSLRGFIALLSQCKALIGNEGGAVNMAKALNIPTFAIFSPWIPKGDWAIFEDLLNQSVHLNDYRPELFKGKNKKDLKKISLELYQEFSPELFRDKRENFMSSLKNRTRD